MARAISIFFFILGSYHFLAYLECVRSYAWSKGHSDLDLSSVLLIIIIILNYLIVGRVVLNSVQMEIHGAGHCGSIGGVKVELQTKSGPCITRPYGEFSAGATIDWTGELLGSCKTANFDPMEKTISLLIKTDIDDSFCPISVKIILNDQNSTSYLLSLPDGDWHNYDDKNDNTYTAEKSLGKI